MTNDNKLEDDLAKLANMKSSSANKRRWYSDIRERHADNALLALLRAHATLLIENNKRKIQSIKDQSK